MKRSKLVFFAVTAAAVLVVVLILVLNPDIGLGNTQNTDGQLDNYPSSSTMPLPTILLDGSIVFPSMPNVRPNEVPGSNPFEVEIESPSHQFKPDGEENDKIPESQNNRYLNTGSVSVNVMYQEKEYRVTFGVFKSDACKYLYLSPSVEPVDQTQMTPPYLQFYFEPSVGYVKTISSSEAGKYTVWKCHSTFERALDYGLPSAYISDEEPGTVWYVNEVSDDKSSSVEEIDITLFSNGQMFACVRLFITQDANGHYSIECAENLNQLDPCALQLGVESRLTEDQINLLIAQLQADAFERCDFFRISENYFQYLKSYSFIIVRREAGKGVMFGYYTDPDGKLQPKSALQDVELYAATIRLANEYGNRTPATIYYKLVKGNNGEDVFELVGLESPNYYYKKSLYYSDYPGWSLTE